IVLPLTSITCAPFGVLILAAGPTAVIWLPLMTTAPFSMGGLPVPSIILAPLRTVTASASAAYRNDAVKLSASNTSKTTVKRRIEDPFLLELHNGGEQSGASNATWLG